MKHHDLIQQLLDAVGPSKAGLGHSEAMQPVVDVTPVL